MKLINKFLVTVFVASLSITSYAGLAGFQAGNILVDTPPVSIDRNSGVASYYADGTSGRIEFSCNLEGNSTGDTVSAYLMPGKNFDNAINSHYIPLAQGKNGPFTWTLTDTGENNGNIRVFYLTGQNVTVQCHGVRLDN